jgi:hypothetical protein
MKPTSDPAEVRRQYSKPFRRTDASSLSVEEQLQPGSFAIPSETRSGVLGRIKERETDPCLLGS